MLAKGEPPSELKPGKPPNPTLLPLDTPIGPAPTVRPVFTPLNGFTAV
jgi:hypothetical protein